MYGLCSAPLRRSSSFRHVISCIKPIYGKTARECSYYSETDDKPFSERRMDRHQEEKMHHRFNKHELKEDQVSPPGQENLLPFDEYMISIGRAHDLEALERGTDYAVPKIKKVEYSADDLTSEEKLMNLFERWMEHHGKQYKSHKEKMKRLNIFRDKLKDVVHDNEVNPHSTKGLNGLSDLSPHEFRTTCLGYIPDDFTGTCRTAKQKKNKKNKKKSSYNH